jgi:hypothetical protein
MNETCETKGAGVSEGMDCSEYPMESRLIIILDTKQPAMVNKIR